jgi:hypothetical protein
MYFNNFIQKNKLQIKREKEKHNNENISIN